MRRIVFACFLLFAYVSLAHAQGRTAIVISDRANLRETPSQIGEIKQEVDIGTNIRVLDRKGAWYVVRIADSVGWMHGNAFRFGRTEQSQPTGGAASSYSTNIEPPPARTRSDSFSRSSSGRTYIRGPRGGCYYYSSSGRKVYVDRSLCTQ